MHGDTERFDAFLSYNSSADSEIVATAAEVLAGRGLHVFLDRWYASPGDNLLKALEGPLLACKSIVIFVGAQGLSRWQQLEREQAVFRRKDDDEFRVITVLLPGCDPPLGFLQSYIWIDFRQRAGDLHERLEKAIRGRLDSTMLQLSRAAESSVCPYRGLAPFREEDAPLFFGRDAEAEELLRKVKSNPITVLIGASGNGKSSLLKAGLAPRLRAAEAQIVNITLSLEPPEAEKKPFRGLAEAFISLLELDKSVGDQLKEANKQAEHLRQGQVELHQFIDKLLERQPGTERLLLIVDGWEELYRLPEQVRNRFVEVLLKSARHQNLHIVLAARAECTGEILEHPGLRDSVGEAIVKLRPISDQQLADVINGPAKKRDLSLDPGLCGRILADARQQPGSLPFLGHALQELWKKRRANQLELGAYGSVGVDDEKSAESSVGGLRAALARHAQRTLEKHDENAVKEILLPLVQATEFRLPTKAKAKASAPDTTPIPAIRRTAPLSDFSLEQRSLVRVLANERLVVTDWDDNKKQAVVDLAHSSLIEDWPQFKKWIQDHREQLLWRTRKDAAEKMLREDWKRLWLGAAAILFLSLLVVVFPLSYLFAPLDLRVYDLLMFNRPNQEAAPQILIVAIDEDAVAAVPGEWPRSRHADLIRQLNAWGAQAAVFVINFPDPKDPPEDKALATAIAESDIPVVLASAREVRLSSAGTIISEYPPLRKFLEAGARYGLATFELDGDKVVRQTRLSFKNQPNLMARVVEAVGDTVKDTGLKSIELPVVKRVGRSGDPFVYINYVGVPGSIESVPFLGLEERKNEFRRKIVLVGLTLATGSRDADRWSSPLGQMSAVEIQANILNTLLTRNYIYPPSASTLLMVAVSGLLVCISTIHLPRFPHAFAAWLLLTMGFVMLSSLAFLYWNHWLTVLQPVAVMFLCFVLSALYRHKTWRKRMDEMQKRPEL